MYFWGLRLNRARIRQWHWENTFGEVFSSLISDDNFVSDLFELYYLSDGQYFQCIPRQMQTFFWVSAWSLGRLTILINVDLLFKPVFHLFLCCNLKHCKYFSLEQDSCLFFQRKASSLCLFFVYILVPELDYCYWTGCSAFWF